MMVEDLRSAFQELVTETDWMDSETQVYDMVTWRASHNPHKGWG